MERSCVGMAAGLVIILCGLLATGASGGDAKDAVKPVDACSLLSKAQVETLTARKVRDPRGESVAAELSTCSYGDPEAPVFPPGSGPRAGQSLSQIVTLSVFTGGDGYFEGPVAQAKAIFEMAGRNAASAEKVGGLGDDAHWDSSFKTLRVLRGRYMIEVTLGSAEGGVDLARKLAAAMLDRLPSAGRGVPPAAVQPPKQPTPADSGLAAFDPATCGGFSAADAAQILGLPAGKLTSKVEQVHASLWTCSFTTGEHGKEVVFSIAVSKSATDAKADMERYRSHLGDNYSDLMGLGDEGVWTEVNRTVAYRKKNVTIQVMQPPDKMQQLKVVKAFLDKI